MVAKPTTARLPQQHRPNQGRNLPPSHHPQPGTSSEQPEAGARYTEQKNQGNQSSKVNGASTAAAKRERMVSGSVGVGGAVPHNYAHTAPRSISLSGQVPAPKTTKGAKKSTGREGDRSRYPQTLACHSSSLPTTAALATYAQSSNISPANIVPTHSHHSPREDIRLSTTVAVQSPTPQSLTSEAVHSGARGPSSICSNSLRLEVHKQESFSQRHKPKHCHNHQAHTLPRPNTLSTMEMAGPSTGQHWDASPANLYRSKQTKHQSNSMCHSKHKPLTATLSAAGTTNEGGRACIQQDHARISVPSQPANRPTLQRQNPTVSMSSASDTNASQTGVVQQSNSSREQVDLSYQTSQPIMSTAVPVHHEQAIARITVDAGAIVGSGRDTANVGNIGMTLHSRSSGAAGINNGHSSKTNCQPSSSHTAGFSYLSNHNTSGMRNHAISPPNLQTRQSQSCQSRPFNSANLHVDIANSGSYLSQTPPAVGCQVTPSSASVDHILTNNLNAGISRGHRERPQTNEALPDILNSHILPPYTVRHNQHRPSRNSRRTSQPGANGNAAQSQGQHSHRRGTRNGRMTQLDEEDKGCCSHEGYLRCITVLTTFRWVLVSLALLGVLCVITGIILGALHMTVSSSFLTLSLMFIGLGVMLVIVVGVGWKCTPQSHEPCHLLFNLGDHSTRDIRSASHRRHRDPNHWYGGVTYPEFRYRRPPPSYNASMQEFQQHIMLAQLQLSNDACADLPPSLLGLGPPPTDDNYSLPSSPPPSYKSRVSTVRPGLHITFPLQRSGYPNSEPPTYCSRGGSSSSHQRPSLNIEEGEDGIDNPACSDAETHCTSSSASGSAFVSAASSCCNSPVHVAQIEHIEINNEMSSTLHRAVDQAVGYLDNVLQSHDQTLEHTDRVRRNGEHGQNNVLGSTTTQGTATGGNVPFKPKEKALTSGKVLNSVCTTSSAEETDRNQDTQL